MKKGKMERHSQHKISNKKKVPQEIIQTSRKTLSGVLSKNLNKFIQKILIYLQKKVLSWESPNFQ